MNLYQFFPSLLLLLLLSLLLLLLLLLLSLLRLLFAQRRWRNVMAVYQCTQMATRIYNQHSYLYRTGYIRTSTLLGFCLTSCGLVSHSWKFWPIIRLTDTSWAVIWSLRLCSLAESWYFKGMTIWVTSFPAISADAFLFFGGTRCERLRSLVSRLKYTQHLNNSTITVKPGQAFPSLSN